MPPIPKKRGNKQPAPKAAPAKKPAPAKRAPAKDKAPTTHAEKLAALVGGISTRVKSAETFLLTEDNLEQLWSRPSWWVSTGSLAVDRALGADVNPGALPGGRLIEIYGPNTSGKTTLLDHIYASVQRAGGVAGNCDVEVARDLTYSRKIGVNTDELIVGQATTMEGVFEWAEATAVDARKLFGPGIPILLGWDSVAGTPTAEEYDAKDPEQQFRASAAKVLRQKCRTTMTTLAKHQVTFVCINQIYSKMQTAQGRHGRTTTFFSDNDETYGGGAIKYHASQRIAIFKQSTIYPRGFSWETKKEGERAPDPIGQVSGVKVVKNKMAAPNKYRTVSILYGQGIDNRVTVFDDFLDSGLIALNGSWYRLDERFGKTKPWQGHGQWGLCDLIDADPELWPKLVNAHRQLR